MANDEHVGGTTSRRRGRPRYAGHDGVGGGPLMARRAQPRMSPASSLPEGAPPAFTRFAQSRIGKRRRGAGWQGLVGGEDGSGREERARAPHKVLVVPPTCSSFATEPPAQRRRPSKSDGLAS